MTTRLGLLVLAAGSMAAVFGQNDSRQASMKGSRGDNGKCTIEVDVDGVAEIEIVGTRADLHTLTGAPARFVRFECNDTLPRYPDDFKFSGIDGRGRQTLIRDPRDNRGIALVRIEDTKGGREGYTFDIEWAGYANSRTNGRTGAPINPGNGSKNGGGGFGNLSPRYGNGNGNGNNPNRNTSGTEQAIDWCTSAVRDKANRDYNYRNIDITNIGLDNNPGRRDWVVGRFIYRRGLTQDEFEFNCSVDFNSGRVRTVEIRRW